jgi:hypothetical protein
LRIANPRQLAEIGRPDGIGGASNSQFTIHSGGLCDQWQAAEIVRSDESSKVWLFHNSQFTIADVAVQPWLIFANSKSRSAFS